MLDIPVTLCIDIGNKNAHFQSISLLTFSIFNDIFENLFQIFHLILFLHTGVYM